MIIIPDDMLGDALDAVAHRRAYPVALELGVSVPRLIQACLEAAREPDVYAQHPAVCRTLVDRVEAARAARSAVHLSVRAEV